MSSVPAWLDNPLLVKYIRTRLRRPALWQSILVLAVITGLIVFWDVARGTWPSPFLFMANGLVQSVILSLIGTSQVVASVGSARESGILDFHRITPEPPSSVTAGFFLGAPIREYLLFLLTLPLSLLCVAGGQGQLGAPTWTDLIQSIAGILFVSWLLHAVGMLSALTTSRPGKSVSGIQVVIVIAFVYLFGFSVSSLNQVQTPGRFPSPVATFYGIDMAWSIGVALLAVPLTSFALTASTRRVRSERAHTLSKSEAIAFMATMAVLVLGFSWKLGMFPWVVYLLVGTGLLACGPTAPLRGEYARGVRRALRSEHRHLPFWDDLALNRVALALICGVVLVSASVAQYSLAGEAVDRSDTSLTVAVAVLTVASFGLALQYFRLVAPGGALSLLTLSVFLVWVVPVILALIIKVTGVDRSYPALAPLLLGFSPLSGLGAISGWPPELRTYVKIAAVLPAVGLPFLLNTLITTRHRRLDRAVRTAGERKNELADESGVEILAEV
jgi:hypothetical protein